MIKRIEKNLLYFYYTLFCSFLLNFTKPCNSISICIQHKSSTICCTSTFQRLEIFCNFGATNLFLCLLIKTMRNLNLKDKKSIFEYLGVKFLIVQDLAIDKYLILESKTCKSSCLLGSIRSQSLLTKLAFFSE
ncbi:hypothetical protein BpHYR1_024687 [Brachionus plicatilis]|uniref:Uncharacterized protein n=1 Tax=Brachionus plicatilis TaxID=10195 RepID=A0A3M7RXR5_BRAPC|nr:hypothetical protein BpHYR1_024687 [Brachionus plicatilis]